MSEEEFWNAAKMKPIVTASGRKARKAGIVNTRLKVDASIADEYLTELSTAWGVPKRTSIVPGHSHKMSVPTLEDSEGELFKTLKKISSPSERDRFVGPDWLNNKTQPPSSMDERKMRGVFVNFAGLRFNYGSATLNPKQSEYIHTYEEGTYDEICEDIEATCAAFGVEPEFICVVLLGDGEFVLVHNYSLNLIGRNPENNPETTP